MQNDYALKLRQIAERITNVGNQAQRIPLLPNNIKADMLNHSRADAKFLIELADYMENTERKAKE